MLRRTKDDATPLGQRHGWQLSGRLRSPEAFAGQKRVAGLHWNHVVRGNNLKHQALRKEIDENQLKILATCLIL